MKNVEQWLLDAVPKRFKETHNPQCIVKNKAGEVIDVVQTTQIYYEDSEEKCKNCGKPFHPRKGGMRQQYCSKKCRIAFNQMQTKGIRKY